MVSIPSEDQIWDPYLYLERLPGKGMRVTHIELFNSVLKAPAAEVEKIVKLVQQLHTTSLLLDDIEDGSVTRRGHPVAHSIFGIPRTINTASFAMLSALKDACIHFPQSRDVLVDELMQLHRGQGLDLYWRDRRITPTEKEYEEMVINKTGGLYRLAVKLLQAASPTNHDLVGLAECLGLIYQIQDDVTNFNPSQNGKVYAEDITEGKYSFPIIHCLHNSPRSVADELLGIMGQHTTDEALKSRAHIILDEAGSFQYSKEAMRRHYHRALELIHKAQLEDPDPLVQLLKKLTEPASHLIQTNQV